MEKKNPLKNFVNKQQRDAYKFIDYCPSWEGYKEGYDEGVEDAKKTPCS